MGRAIQVWTDLANDATRGSSVRHCCSEPGISDRGGYAAIGTVFPKSIGRAEVRGMRVLCIPWPPFSVSAAEGFLGKVAILANTPRTLTCQILESKVKHYEMIVVNSRPAGKWRDRERLCCAKLMISHSAPFAATAFLGMSLLLGPPLDKMRNPIAGTPTPR